jgi:hypothetical protein
MTEQENPPNQDKEIYQLTAIWSIQILKGIQSRIEDHINKKIN